MSWDPFQREMLEALGYRVYAAVAPMAIPPSTGNATAASDILRALARAASVQADALPQALDLETLRADPAAKRKLWPQLRRMRASGAR